MWRAWWRAIGARAPLSGDVAQAIDASVIRSLGQQLGFININTGGAGDPDLERRITEVVASYGRQLGRVLDAVDVLVRRDSRGELPAEDEQALDEFRSLHTQINAVKERAAAERLDRLLADIRLLKHDPAANENALRRLREALAEN